MLNFDRVGPVFDDIGFLLSSMNNKFIVKVSWLWLDIQFDGRVLWWAVKLCHITNVFVIIYKGSWILVLASVSYLFQICVFPLQ